MGAEPVVYVRLRARGGEETNSDPGLGVCPKIEKSAQESQYLKPYPSTDVDAGVFATYSRS